VIEAIQEISAAFAAAIGADQVQLGNCGSDQLKAILAEATGKDSAELVVISPSSGSELAAVMAQARRDRLAVMPFGSGSKLTWGNPRRNVRLALSTQRLNRLVEHAAGDLTVTIEAGMRLKDLQAQLALTGQFLPVDGLYPNQTTIGGLIATADTGSWRQRYGGIRDLLIGLSFVRHDGQIAKAGGRVVKNVAGYDLMKLLTGSYGTLGIISQATFRLYPIPPASRTVLFTGAAQAIAELALALGRTSLTPTAIDILSPALAAIAAQTVNLTLGDRDLGLLVRFQSLPVSVTDQVAQLLALPSAQGLQTCTISDESETQLWGQILTTLGAAMTEPVLLGKLGVRSTAVLELMGTLQTLPSGLAIIHARSGVGRWRCQASSAAIAQLSLLRSLCQATGGYFTLLQAPTTLKQKFAPWGEVGSALGLMQRIKHQFDPDNLLNPGCFVGSL